MARIENAAERASNLQLAAEFQKSIELEEEDGKKNGLTKEEIEALTEPLITFRQGLLEEVEEFDNREKMT